MPDCEWLIRIVPPSLIASCDSAGTVGLGVGKVAFQSATICFQNSLLRLQRELHAVEHLRVLRRRSGRSPTRPRGPAEKIGGRSAAGALPIFTLLNGAGSIAERPRATWSIT